MSQEKVRVKITGNLLFFYTKKKQQQKIHQQALQEN